MSNNDTKYVVVDWRPYDLPTVLGPFDSEEEAGKYYLWLHELDEDELLQDGAGLETLDGIDVLPINPTDPNWKQAAQR